MPDPDPSPPLVAVLSRDVFFGMRIRNALRQLGYGLTLVTSEEELATTMATGPVLALVDFNTPVDWRAVGDAVAAHASVPVVAFGAHTDIDGFRQAREAGVARVVSNGAFTRQLPDILTRYARTPPE